MKLTFERETFAEIQKDMVQVLADAGWVMHVVQTQAVPTDNVDSTGDKLGAAAEPLQGSSPDQGPDAAPEAPPKEAPKNSKAKPKEAKKKSKEAKPEPKAAEPEAEAEPEADAADPLAGLRPEPKAKPKAEPEPEPEPTLTPAEMAALRTKTIEDLQAAYSGGQQKAVFELLAKFGNGAKSFRELTVKDFIPIRKAIDEGALL